jgi:hypothetical protein
MTREDMLTVVLTPPSVGQEENELQWMTERIGTFTDLLGCFHELAYEDRMDDLKWLLEQWSIAQRQGV